ncbi:hypothetical protein IMZ48_50065 [Candidatus Bathyarchaeota archaeon]|nr:hypothetical protein [Candidatus Bathyarchaeota archaeon]
MVEIKGPLSGPRDRPGGAGSSGAAEGGGAEARTSTASNAPVDPTPTVQGSDDEPPESRAEPASTRLSMRRHRVPTVREVEILKLRSCGHWFHARCLSSWFLIDRYDCPVCRKRYWNGRAGKIGALETFLRIDSPTPTGARMGLGTMV